MTAWRRLLAAAGLLLCSLLPAARASAAAPDKSGVSPTVVSLPAGPGSIEGLGESFQPMMNTGMARYAVAIPLPAGAGGAPTLRLTYDGGLGQGPAGMGWRFGPGGIGRRTDQGLPRYVDGPNGADDDLDGEVDEADERDVFLGPDGEELVSLGDGTWRARIEGGFVRYRRVAEHWEADLPGGTRVEYGLTPDGRVADASGVRVFTWLPERSTDANGNVTEHRWGARAGSEGRRYLREIRWGAGAPPWAAFHFARLSYEGRPDVVEDCRPGYRVVTGSRLVKVDVGIQGASPDGCAPGDHNGDGVADALVARWTVEYDATHPRHSLLQRVTRYGSDGVNRLPPVTFGYSSFEPARSLSAAVEMAGSVNAPPVVMDSGLSELVDLNRDGLADILRTDIEGGVHTAYLNLGEAGEGGGRAVRWDDGRPMASTDGLALQLRLAEDRVSLADMDGDGLADLVHHTQGGDVHYYANRGTAGWGDRSVLAPVEERPPAPFALDGVRTSDLDGDKRTDVVMSTDSGYSVWFNLGGGRLSREARTSGARWMGQVIQFSAPGVHLADINGDRLDDAVRVTPTAVVWAASLGRGVFGEAREMAIPDAVLTDGTDGQVGRAKLADVDGDGLDDLVVERAVPGELWLWLNGGGTLGRRTVVGDLPAAIGAGAVVRWADMNGNGTTDLVWADSAAEPRIRYLDVGRLAGGSAHPNLLTAVDNGLGVTTSISYLPSTGFYLADREAGDPWTTTIPFPVQVVSRVETGTGLDLDQVSGADVYVKEYRYRDGFYEDRERAFRGFARVEVTEPGDAAMPGVVGVHRFFTGGPDGADNDGDGLVDEVSPEGHREEEALKGLAISTEIRAPGGAVFRRDENHWQARNLLVSPDGVEVRWAYNASRDTVLVEGTASPETLRTTWVYDGFGHTTEERNLGALSIDGDEAFTFTDDIDDTSRWVLGRPWRQRVTDAGGTTVAETYSYYDGEPYAGLPAGSLTRGNLTRRTGWVTDGGFVDLERKMRDEWGSVTGLMDGKGNMRTIVYDPLLRRFPVSETVAVGGGKPDLSIAVEYNLGLGVPASATGFDGETTTFGHDVFGRLTSVIKPGDTALYPTSLYEYAMADPAQGLLYSYDSAGSLTLIAGPVTASFVASRGREVSGGAGTLDSVAYVDGLKRALAAVGEGESGYVVTGAATFNARGTPHRSWLPYAAAGAGYARPSAGPAAETRYDATGREVLRVNPPDGAAVVTQASTAWLPLVKTVTDENGEVTTFVSDGQGRVVEVRRSNGAGTLVTRYAYDALGRLTGMTDALGNTWSRAYDGLGRLVRADDPDRGRTDYVYDAAGNLVRTTDSKGQSIRYAYDGANRILTETDLVGPLPQPTVTWHYDEPSPEHPDATGTRGRLAWVEHESGAWYYSYDARGNVSWTLRRLAPGGTASEYLTRSTYDALGRTVTSTFPDGDRVSYLYNARGLLESIPGIVEGIDYRPSGAVESLFYGNGVRTDYAFDPRGRVTGLLTSPAAPGDPLQDLAYTFDGVSNVTAIDDLRPIVPGDPSDATRNFGYDHLHRLTRAAGPGFGTVDFAWDAIGNQVFASSPAAPDPAHIDDPLVNLGAISHGGAGGSAGRGPRLPGDPPGPHAVSGTASGLSFAYDDNGNMTANGSDSYEWDFRDRLTRAVTAGADTRYWYDHAGRRTAKLSDTGGSVNRTLYVDPTYEVRDGRPVKLVFAGGRRVARVEGRLTGGGITQTLPLRPGWNLVSLEVEPADPAVASVLGPISDSWSGVWEYDAGAGAYVGNVPSQGVSDLAELHALKGYLILVTAACELEVSGTPASGVLVLQAGWNLVASPAGNAMPVAEAFSSPLVEAVWGYRPLSASWAAWMPARPVFLDPLETVEPGRSYWVKVSTGLVMATVPKPTAITWHHPDHLGSSSLTTDAAGAVVERTEFHPFGRVRHREGPGPSPEHLFTGKERDLETGLDYFGARYYNAVTASFVSADPQEPAAGDPATLNRYAYARGNPLAYLDPDGKQDFNVVGDVAAFEEMKAELLKSKEARDLLGRLGKDLTISIKAGNGSSFDPKTNTIYIDPRKATIYEKDNRPVSFGAPVMALAHEMVHSVSWKEHPELWDSRMTQRSSDRSSTEEDEAVELTNRIGKQLDWAQRPEYGTAMLVQATSTTASVITWEQYRNYKARQMDTLRLLKQGRALKKWVGEELPFSQETRESLQEIVSSYYNERLKKVMLGE